MRTDLVAPWPTGPGRERVTGIEPAWPAWKAGALPLSYTRAPHLRLDEVYGTSLIETLMSIPHN
jgi:hypothetical protein